MTATISFTLEIFLSIAPLIRRASLPSLSFALEMAFVVWRLFLKCHFAEQITKEEGRLADDISSWNLVRSNAAVRYEAKNLIDLITVKPTRVVYGSVILVNKNLVLSVRESLLITTYKKVDEIMSILIFADCVPSGHVHDNFASVSTIGLTIAPSTERCQSTNRPMKCVHLLAKWERFQRQILV
jgi:hypothetical protein